MNESLIEDESLVGKLKEAISETNKACVVDAVRRELFKEEAKLITFRYSHDKAARTRAEKRTLEETVQILTHEENRSPGLFASGILECKAKLFSILEKEFHGTMVRCRLHALHQAEEPLKIFKTKERNHIRSNRITSLQTGDKIVSEQSDIEKELVDTFTEPLSEREDTDEITLEKYLQVMPQIPRDNSEKISGKLQIKKKKPRLTSLKLESLRE